MDVQLQPHVTTTQRHLLFECVAPGAGGVALGAFQAGFGAARVDSAAFLAYQ